MGPFLVSDIWEEARKIVGNEDEKFLFRRITDAVELLSNKGDFDPLLRTLDVCTEDQIITLPTEVETILGCNFCGKPAIARDEFFQFHINGPGTFGWGNWGGGVFGPEIRYEWMDLNDSPTFRDPPCPDQVYALCLEDDDINCEFWAEGFDKAGNVVRSKGVDGKWRNGWKVPVFKNITALSTDAPIPARITAIKKSLTAGPIRLWTAGQILLGVYQGNETVPHYRKIKLGRPVPWVRIRFRMRTFEVHNKYDLIPVNSKQALLMMLRALKAYDTPGEVASGEAFEATAVRWVTEEQFTSNPPVGAPMQVLNSAPLLDSWDYME